MRSADDGMDKDPCDSLSLSVKVLLSIVFAMVILVVHGGSYHGAFLLDDTGSIVDNASIRSLSSLWAVLSEAQFTTVAGRPLLNLSLALNYAVGGLRPEGYHLVNYAIHWINALLLFGILRRCFVVSPATTRLALPLASSIALLWSVHPLTINGVSYIVQRGEAITSLCYLGVMWAFIKGVQTPDRRWLVCGVAVAWLGSLTKEVIATVPAAIIALDAMVITGNWKTAIRCHWRIYLGIVSCWIPLAVCMVASRNRAGTVGYEMGISVSDHIQTQIWAFSHYLSLAVWPAPLVFDYGGGLILSATDSVGLAAMIILGFGVVEAWLLRQNQRIALLGLLLCMLLSPTMVIPIVSQPVAEHRMYLASACVVTCLGVAVALVLQKMTNLNTAKQASVLLCVMVTFECVLGSLTMQQTKVLLTPDLVWSDVIQKRPNNQRAMIALGTLRLSSNAESSKQLFELAIAHGGRYLPRAYEGRSRFWLQMGERDKALSDLTMAIQSNRYSLKMTKAHQERAMVLRDLERYDEALDDLVVAEQIDPNDSQADVIRASIHVAKGEFQRALEALDGVISRDIKNPIARYRRIAVLAKLEKWEPALQDIRYLQKAGYRIDKALVQSVEEHAITGDPNR